MFDLDFDLKDVFLAASQVRELFTVTAVVVGSLVNLRNAECRISSMDRFLTRKEIS